MELAPVQLVFANACTAMKNRALQWTVTEVG